MKLMLQLAFQLWKRQEIIMFQAYRLIVVVHVHVLHATYMLMQAGAKNYRLKMQWKKTC